jgi:hypothetical protein
MKLNQNVTLEKLFGKKQFKTNEELWSTIVSHQQKFTDQWRNWLHWTQKGHSITTDNKYLQYALMKSGIKNVFIETNTELKKEYLGKPMYCKQCGKMFISLGDTMCNDCIETNKENEDPYIVAIQNIEVMLSDLHTIKNKRQRYNARRELAWVLNKAYHRGYIGEEYYMSSCSLINANANLDTEYGHMSKDYYDNSDYAKEGFYFETMFSGEEE